MNRIVPTALTTVALLVPTSVLAPAATAAPAEAGTAITGTWKGQVFGDNGADAGYRARVRIVKRNGELRGRVEKVVKETDDAATLVIRPGRVGRTGAPHTNPTAIEVSAGEEYTVHIELRGLVSESHSFVVKTSM